MRTEQLKKENLHRIVIAWVNVCRFLLAITFIASGFIKANDPYGTAYKIQDYLEAWGMMDMFPSVLTYIGAMTMGIIEFALGLYLFFGIHRRIIPTVMLIVMSFFTPLTLWLAIDNPISDCGCFGDALVLSNWETFFKNLALLIAAISIFKWRKVHLYKIVSSKVDWLVSLYSILFIICYSIYTIRYLPVFDFRPYHIGADIAKGMTIPEGEKMTTYETTFIYEKDGKQQEFTIDNCPTDSTWTFIDAKTRVKEKGYEQPIHDFAITSVTDGEDLTESVLNDDRYTFLLVSTHLAEADDSNMDLINEIYDYCIEHKYNFLCVTASPDKDIDSWTENTGAEYPFALMDDITLKTMVRSNPGLILLKKGVVINKWSVNRLPDEYQLNKPLDKLLIGQLNPKTLPHKILMVAGWFFGPLAVFILCDLIWISWKRRRSKKEDKENETKE